MKDGPLNLERVRWTLPESYDPQMGTVRWMMENV
jgi:hypothetical protein